MALYTPHSPATTHTIRFLERINADHHLSLQTYHDLHKWSVDNIDKFWSAVWDDTDIVGIKGSHVVDTLARPPENPDWFSEAQVNYAENMLRCRSEGRLRSFKPLYALVADLVSAFLARGLKPGDRIASYSSNCVENVAACLACAAIGCIWVSAAADFGPEGVFERTFTGSTKSSPASLSLSMLWYKSGLRPEVVVIRHPFGVTKTDYWNADWTDWDTLVADGATKKLGRTADGEIEWKRLDFNWPLWILFSSGTTGRPKPIVHRAGGMLIQAKKEFVICADLQPADVFFYYTTTGWMMWNFLVSGLSVGCTLVLYDGSPLYDPAYLWRLVDELGITIFGTSAKYIDQLAKVHKPAEHHALTTLRHIYSTGSPLAPHLFDFVYDHIKRDVLLGSITGGTDICSLFAGMCTALPVFRGEIQCRLLGMAVEAFTPAGAAAGPDEAGDLPAGFWPLPGYGNADAVEVARKRYQDAYFSEFEGVWYHGDHIMITSSRAGNGGGIVMLGRSDGVLNPGGVRFGSAEIYDVIEECFAPAATHAAHAVADCLAVGQNIANNTDERVVLFVKLLEGQTLTEELTKRIKTEIVQVADIPYTVNMKRVEVPVKKIINGAPVSSVNPATLRNAECLGEYERIGVLLRAEA
ncbi:acetoacyl-CoA synthetase [Epithele typhae]|uniref:acetoacyl-CoA synthetase n=1 Tax=Epithele typhae TaxID=378194 RepID=UPI0020088F21|nr:acetoacyl-CoA synthetase [Epithele typhae]KAH9943407.1 acetoacyl-CoA synthetase [Epithele typhae]